MITELESVVLVDDKLQQRDDLRCQIFPPPTPPPMTYHLPDGGHQTPATPDSPLDSRQPLTPSENYGYDLWILLRLYNITMEG